LAIFDELGHSHAQQPRTKLAALSAPAATWTLGRLSGWREALFAELRRCTEPGSSLRLPRHDVSQYSVRIWLSAVAAKEKPSMRKALSRIVPVVLGVALAVLTMGPAANAAATPSTVTSQVITPNTTGDLGGMMLSEYCIALGFQGARVSDNGQSNPWVCYNGPYFSPLDLFGACRWQFRDLQVAGFNVTYFGNGRCWALNATNYSSPSDLNQIGDYCRSLGYANAEVAYRNVAGWRCRGYDGSWHLLDLHAACRWVNAGLVAQGFSLVSYFNRYGDTFAIRCLSMKHT
jgi:hypothetical protein